ncbi:hypothetical protein [Arthrobacter cryoconiti]|uniref:KTSC domain-containing protein n=1 Tax=Arthrobacter cryoconiti TaxID=748907 RepID=A0ABV8QV14_9MICC|nr:hypothetical protein [Arthrobacter cryoconiti]MCC9069665.1 hypothetical protein [Arthrobacter cryoconiti]
MITLLQDSDGYIRMSKHFPASVQVSITFSDGTAQEYSGRRLNGLYDDALASYRAGNQLDAKGYKRNAQKIGHKRNAVDHVPVQSGMAH